MADVTQTRSQLQTALADNTAGAITAQTLRNLVVSVPFNVGAWSGSTAYVANDLVSSGGATYLCILAHSNQQPPNATYWEAIGGSTSGLLAAANNLSDLDDVTTAQSNLGLGSAATEASTAFDAAGAASTAQAASLQKSSNLSDLASAATARTNLGLGSAATSASTAFDAAGAASTAQAASLQKSSNLSDLASAATARTNLGLGSAATSASTAFDAAGAAAAAESASLPLSGGTMSGNVAMGGNNISGGGTATFTTFAGALTGHASLDVPLTGGTMSGTLNMGTSGAGGYIANCRAIQDAQATPKNRLTIGGLAGTGATSISDSNGAAQITITPGTTTINAALSLGYGAVINLNNWPLNLDSISNLQADGYGDVTLTAPSFTATGDFIVNQVTANTLQMFPQVSAATSGTVTMGGNSYLILTSPSPITALTIDISAFSDTGIVSVTTVSAIASLTWTVGGGYSMIGAPSSMAAGQNVKFQLRSNVWYPA